MSPFPLLYFQKWPPLPPFLHLWLNIPCVNGEGTGGCLRRTATGSRLRELLYCWNHVPSLIPSQNKSRIYGITCLYTLCGTCKVSPALARNARYEPKECFHVEWMWWARKRRAFSSQHSVSHPSLWKGPGRGTSLHTHRNVLSDVKRLGIIVCVLVSRNADSTFLLVPFKRECGLAICVWSGQSDHRLQLDLWCSERWGGWRLYSCITVDKEGKGGWVLRNVKDLCWMTHINQIKSGFEVRDPIRKKQALYDRLADIPMYFAMLLLFGFCFVLISFEQSEY